MSLQRKFGTVGGATIVSRLTGFVRDAIVAALLGASPVADALLAAFLLPNVIRRMLAEGALNAAFIPIFARREAQHGTASARDFAEDAFGFVAAALVAVLAAAFVMAPALMTLLAGGFLDEPAKFDLSVRFIRLLLIFVAAQVLSAVIASILNALGRYVVPSLAPSLLNVLTVAGLVALLGLREVGPIESGFAFVGLLAVSGLAVLLLMSGVAWQAGFLPRPRLAGWLGTRPDVAGIDSRADIRRFALVLLPGILIAGVGHINIMVAARMASSVPSAVSWLYYADRLFQLPLGFVAAAIGIVLLPSVAKAMHDDDRQLLQGLTGRSLEFALAIALPAAGALLLLANPIVSILYQRGHFLESDAGETARILAILACGLPGFVLIKVLLPAFLARERFAVPVMAALAGVAANGLAAWFLLPAQQHLAPPWGVTVAAWLNAAILAIALWRRDGLGLDALALARLPRIVLASALTLVAVAALAPLFAPAMAGHQPLLLRAPALGVLCCVGVLCQAALLHGFGVIDLRVLGKVGRGDRPN